MAAALGNVDLVKELLRSRAAHDAVDAYGNTAMHLACENGHVDVVSVLLDGLGRRTVLRMKNKAGQVPLHCAAAANQEAVVQVLMQAGTCAAIKDKVGHQGWVDPHPKQECH